ncbi:MAG: PAS domain S-box protein [Deltaproteobacteria bacterium]|nr:PAS domain S-box protein [Deltaproteobacteria bacterium]
MAPNVNKGRHHGHGNLRYASIREKIKETYHSPVKLLLIIAGSTFVTESLVMLFLYALASLTGMSRFPFADVFLDSTILVILLAPVLYYFLFRPLLHLVDELAEAEDGFIAERDTAQRYLDIAGVMIVVLDAKGRVSLINKRGREILGYEESEIVGRDWFVYFVPDRIRGALVDAFERLKENTGAPLAYRESPVINRIGEERVILWHHRPLFDGERFAGTISSGTDVTEQKMAADALVDAEARYRMVHSTAFDGIIISDESDNIMDCNPSAEKIFGYGAKGLLGLPLTDIMPEKYRERHLRGLKRFLSTNVSAVQGRVLELEGLKKNGAVFPIELILGSFNIGAGVYFTGTIRDITEKRRAEKEKDFIQLRLNQAQKMEAIGRLAGGIAHDFNNVLTAIRGNAELTLEDAGDNPLVSARLREIILTSQLASKLTRQLLLFSRGVPFELTNLDVNKTIEGLLTMVRRIIGDDISIAVELFPGLWTCLADETSIEQVVMNLAVNARDAMPQGGRLLIKTENVTLTEGTGVKMPDARPGDAVCLTVADNGAGMEKEVVERIFEPFFTTKDAAKEQGGMGFGLSVVYGIVKKHGGWINLRSAPGAGASFGIYLPSAKAVEKKAEVAAVSRSVGSGERILVVEAEERVMEFAKTALTGNGYTIFTAANVQDAVLILDKENAAFDVLLADASVSGGGGVIGLISYARAKNPSVQVILTGSFMVMSEITRWGADRKVRYLQKPFSLAGLLRAVSIALEQARLRP